LPIIFNSISTTGFRGYVLGEGAEVERGEGGQIKITDPDLKEL